MTEDEWWEQEESSEEKPEGAYLWGEENYPYRLNDTPPLPPQECILKFLDTKEQTYLAWYLHFAEPKLNQKALALEQNYSMYGFFLDLKQACVEGLVAAAEKYDPAQGVSFWWYACQYEIPKAVHAYIRQARPGFSVESASEYKTLRNIMWLYGEGNSISEIAEKTGLSEKTVQTYVQAGMRNRQILPLDQDEEDERTQIPTPDYGADPARVYLQKCRHEILFSAFGNLSFKEKDVVSRHLGFCSRCLSTKDTEGKPLPAEFFEDIAVSYGVTPKEISTIYNKAIGKLRKNTENIKNYQDESVLGSCSVL